MSAYLSLIERRRGGRLFEAERLLTFSAFRIAKISAVRSLADICFLHVLIWLITCIILSVCVSVFLVLSILHTVI